jgi:hypothetical protein
MVYSFSGVGGFKMREVKCIVKYCDDLVLPSKEAMVLQSVINRLFEIGRSYVMEVNMENIR